MSCGSCLYLSYFGTLIFCGTNRSAPASLMKRKIYCKELVEMALFFLALYHSCPGASLAILVAGALQVLESWLLAVKCHIKTADIKITIGDLAVADFFFFSFSPILDRLSLAGTILVLDLGSWSLTSDLHVNERRRANGWKPVRDQYQYQCFDSTSSEGANWYHSNSCPRGKKRLSSFSVPSEQMSIWGGSSGFPGE